MSVSLCVLRLEHAADHSPLLSPIDYTAPKYLDTDLQPILNPIDDKEATRSRMAPPPPARKKKSSNPSSTPRGSPAPPSNQSPLSSSSPSPLPSTPPARCEVDEERLKTAQRGNRTMKDLVVETVAVSDTSLIPEVQRRLSESSTATSGGDQQHSGQKDSSKESTPESQLSGQSNTATQPQSGVRRANSLVQPPPQASRTAIQFVSGNHFVESTKGILHLYKEDRLTALSEEAGRSEIVCMLAIPSALTVHDLLQFTAPLAGSIEHIRIVRDASKGALGHQVNHYMALLKFSHQRSADEFYRQYNGQRYNSIEPDVCHLVYVARVESLSESCMAAAAPLQGHTELPTCPVCLERMDESVEGILTILCNHSFHSNCLDKWSDSTCPVCRYVQTPEPLSSNSCSECGSRADSLWICLICGHVGCGRYENGHAYEHYRATHHTYAMQCGSGGGHGNGNDNHGRVWDYAGDNYVHRLLANKTDGKLVEFDRSDLSGLLNSSYPVERTLLDDEKVDSVQLEFTYLLTSQLESQREYYDEQIAQATKVLNCQLDETLEKNQLLETENKELRAKVDQLTKERSALDRKVGILTTKLSKVTLELTEEREMNKYHRRDQEVYAEKLKKTEERVAQLEQTYQSEVKDLTEQIRDLMFYVEGGAKLREGIKDDQLTQDEIDTATVVVGDQPAGSSNTPSEVKRGARRKKK